MKKLLAIAGLVGLFAAAAIAASPIQLGGSIFPLTLISQAANNSVDEFNQLEILINAQVMPISGPQATINTQGITFSNAANGNPLMLDFYQDIAVSTNTTVNNSTTRGLQFLTAQTSRTIYPGIPVVTVSGTASAATNLTILCSPSARVVATYVVSNLISTVPNFPISAGTGQGNSVGVAMASGCASGDGVNISTGGSALATTTDVFINMPYTVQ